MDSKTILIAMAVSSLTAFPISARTLGDFRMAEKHVILEDPSVSPTVKGEMGPLRYWSADYSVTFPTAFGDNDLTELFKALTDATGVDYTDAGMQIVRTPEGTNITSLPGSKMCGRTLDVKNNTVTLTDDYIAWSTTTYIENGDGRRTTDERFINYYVPDNALLDAGSVFTDEGRAAVADAIMAWIETERPSAYDKIKAAGGAKVTDNFYIKSNGDVVFVYGQGELTPDVTSLLRVTIPASDIAGSLTLLGHKLSGN